MDGEELGDDGFLVAGQGLGDGGEDGLQFGVGGLRGEGLGPVEGEVEVRAAVVDGAELAARGTVELKELAGGGVEGVGEDLGLRQAEGFGDVFEGRGQGEELAEGVPAEVVFLGELLDVLRSGTTGTGFKESAAVHEGNDGEHLGRGADFEDREEVGVVIAQDVAGDGNGVLALDNALQREGAGLGGRKDAEVEAGGVVVLQVGLDLGDDLGVVGAVLVEPEDGGIAGRAGAFDGQLHPVLDGGVLGLAGAPDVTGLDFVL